jgi:hypothetical protein
MTQRVRCGFVEPLIGVAGLLVGVGDRVARSPRIRRSFRRRPGVERAARRCSAASCRRTSQQSLVSPCVRLRPRVLQLDCCSLSSPAAPNGCAA